MDMQVAARSTALLIVKICAANVLPVVLWLFAPGLRGNAFWGAWGILSVIAAAMIWFAVRTTPDPTHLSEVEIPTPGRAAMGAVFQIALYIACFAILAH